MAVIAIGMTAGAHRFVGSSVLVSHLLYLPSLLAAVWWGWRGLGVSLGMSAALLFSHQVFLGSPGLGVEIGRAGIIAGVSALTALLSEQIAQRDRALRRTSQRLDDAARELALAEERQRRGFATALHDQLGQDLVALKINLGLLREEILPAQRTSLKETLTLVDRAIARVRTLTFDVCPPALYEGGLIPALEWLCDSFEERTGIQFRLEPAPSIPPMKDEILGLVFRAVRELLQNVVKHAQASSGRVRVRLNQGELRIRVADDGIGFETDAILATNAMTSGFGIFSIRKHLEYLGGELEIESLLGEGTWCTIILPLVEDHGESRCRDDQSVACR